MGGALVKLGEKQETVIVGALVWIYSVLTKGDTLTVPLPDGNVSTVKILELKTGKNPKSEDREDADAVCLIDTNLEVEITPTEEYWKAYEKDKKEKEMQAAIKA